MKITKIGAAIFIALMLLGAFVEPPEQTPQQVELEIVEAAKEDLINRYRMIYRFGSCDTREVASDWFVLCRPDSDKAVGSLFHIVLGDDGRYFITPINGKAKQHARITGMILYQKQKQYDIPAILAVY